MARPRARALILAAAVSVVAALPSAADAAVMRLGSDLQKPANWVEAHGPDSAFWNVSIDGASGAMPADGQVTFIRVKGTVLKDPSGAITPSTLFHFQTLRPLGDGRVRVMLSSSGFHTPHGGDPQQITGYTPVNFCVKKGDYVDFNDVGGAQFRWGPYDGMPFQVFSRTPESQMALYLKADGTNIGAEFAPADVKQGVELLMQTTLATGPDASDMCPGGYRQHVFEGLELTPQDVTISATKRIAKLKTKCPPRTYGRCRGVLTLKALLNGTSVTLGGAPFVIKPGWSDRIELQLTKRQVRQIKKAGGARGTITAVGRDDPRSDDRADPAVPVQSKTTTGRVRLKVG